MQSISIANVWASNHKKQDEHEQSHGAVVEHAKQKIKKPPLFKVLLMNDDYTPMEFVVYLLIEFFHMSNENAHQVMMHVHTRGRGVCGVYPREIAETKVQQVMDLAAQHQHPLRCVMEKE